MTRKIRIVISVMIWLLSSSTMAGNPETEIQHLLESVGQSNCIFVRNGESHAATEAESHLRMKYRRGKFWVDNSEQFIERIASKSSWSGKPYFIECPDSNRQSSGDWLLEKLAAYRKET